MENHTLYRAFDASGNLLYVGIARYWPRRIAQHAKFSHWFVEAASFTFETYANRGDVLRAERAAIESEKPRHNVRMNAVGREQFASEEGPSRDETWHFADARNSRLTYSARLHLVYELAGADCLRGDECDPLATYTQALRSWSVDPSTLPIRWFVATVGSKAPQFSPFPAPFAPTRGAERFLDQFTWPETSDGQRLNFYSLPVVSMQPELERRLRWRPGALQSVIDFEALAMNAGPER